MSAMLVRAAIQVAAAAIGLLVAKVAVDDMSLSWGSFLLVVVVFGALQAVLAPFVAKVTARQAPALLSAVGLLTTLLALIATSILTDGLAIRGATTWLLVALIVWLVTMVAALLLPVLLGKAGVRHGAQRRSRR
jgi:hypothetical protein